MLLHAEAPFEWLGRGIAVAGLTTAGWIYATGWRRSHRRLPAHFTTRQRTVFLGGLGCLLGALVSPLDGAADRLLSAHMVQHILLLTIAPGLLLLGHPLLPLLYGMPDGFRRSLVAPLVRHRPLRAAARALVFPPVALLLSSAIFWLWHLPAPYQLALRVPSVHLLEHASFLLGGLLFWYPVVQPWPGRPRWP